MSLVYVRSRKANSLKDITPSTSRGIKALIPSYFPNSRSYVRSIRNKADLSQADIALIEVDILPP